MPVRVAVFELVCVGCLVDTPVFPVRVAVFELVCVGCLVDTPVWPVRVAVFEFVRVPPRVRVCVPVLPVSSVSSPSPPPGPELSSSWLIAAFGLDRFTSGALVDEGAASGVAH